MRAIGVNICVKKVKERQELDGFILGKKESSDVRYLKAIVKSVGSEVPNIKEGDVVFFDKARAFSLLDDGVRFTFCKYSDIVAVD